MIIPALMLAVAACGTKKGSDIPTANGAEPAATGSLSSEQRRERALKFTQCMREHGIDMPDPDGGEFHDVGTANKDKMNDAAEACRQYMPTDNEMVKPSAEDIENLRKFAQCMREHGIVKFPDPSPDGLNLGGTGLDPQDATFKTAEEACKDVRPKRPGSGS
jgi:hypothetical protein